MKLNTQLIFITLSRISDKNPKNNLNFEKIQLILYTFLSDFNSSIKSLIISKELHKNSIKNSTKSVVKNQWHFHILLEHTGLPVDLKYFKILRKLFPDFVGKSCNIVEVDVTEKVNIENYIKKTGEFFVYNKELIITPNSQLEDLLIPLNKNSLLKKKIKKDVKKNYNELFNSFSTSLTKYLEIPNLGFIRGELNNLINLKKEEIVTNKVFNLQKNVFLQEYDDLCKLEEELFKLKWGLFEIIKLNNSLLESNKKILEIKRGKETTKNKKL